VLTCTVATEQGTVTVTCPPGQTAVVTQTGVQSQTVTCPATDALVGCTAQCAGAKAGGYVFLPDGRSCEGTCNNALEVQVSAVCAAAGDVGTPQWVVATGPRGTEVTCPGGTYRTGCAARCTNSSSGGPLVTADGCGSVCDNAVNVEVTAICVPAGALACPPVTTTATGPRGTSVSCGDAPLLDCTAACNGGKSGGGHVTGNDCVLACDAADVQGTVAVTCLDPPPCG
jgi:hypothetical protein